jgi:hypothetical protein
VPSELLGSKAIPKAKNPRRIVNAGALIGESLAPRELGLLVTVVQSAKATASEAEAKTLSLPLAKLRKALDWKALNTKVREV